jgi:hypothetical protein
MYEDHFTHTFKTVENVSTIREESLCFRRLHTYWGSLVMSRCIMVDECQYFGIKYVYYSVNYISIEFWLWNITFDIISWLEFIDRTCCKSNYNNNTRFQEQERFAASNKSQWNVYCVGPETQSFFFPHGVPFPSGLGPLHCRIFMITIRHTTLGRTPLDDWSARRRDLCLITLNIHKRQTTMSRRNSNPQPQQENSLYVHPASCHKSTP